MSQKIDPWHAQTKCQQNLAKAIEHGHDAEARHSKADDAVLEYLQVIAPHIARLYEKALKGTWYA